MHSRRAETSGQIVQTSKEIEELELLLKMKQAEHRRLRLELEGIDSRINDVRRKYDRQLQRIQDRTEAIESNKLECELEHEMAVTERDRFNADVIAKTKSCEDLRNWLGCLGEELNIASSIVKATFCKSEVLSSFTAKSLSSTQQSLKHKLASADAELSQAKTNLTDISTKMDLLVTESRDLSDKIPALEAEKKAHAAAKRFKEAASLAKEIKALTSRKEEVEQYFASTSSLLHEKQTKVADCIFEQQRVLNDLAENRKTASVDLFYRLLGRIGEINDAVEKIKTKAKEYDHHSLIPPALVMMEAQLAELVEEADAIKIEYSLSESVCGKDDKHDSEPDFGGYNTNLIIEAVADSSKEGAEEPIPQHLDAEEKHYLILEAKEILAKVDHLQKSIEAAVEVEEYDHAAALDEALGAAETSLSNSLRILGCSREFVVEYVDNFVDSSAHDSDKDGDIGEIDDEEGNTVAEVQGVDDTNDSGES